MTDFIPIAEPIIGREEAQAVFDQVLSGWITMGKRVIALEDRICQITGARNAIAMANGTATLHAALACMGVGPGDDVVVPTLSYISSANAVLYCGANVVFCEVDPKTFNVTAEALDASVTPATKVVMPVDLKGQPVDFDDIGDWAKKRGVTVLADSAESFGAAYKGKSVGTQAPAHSFSFFANKNITLGEGGAVTTDDDSLAEQLRMFRNQGQSERYNHVMLGHNYRVTDVAAALGLAQMDRLEHVLDRKAEIAAIYSERFGAHPLIDAPFVPEYATRPSWYMYTITLAPTVNRDGVLERMKQAGVDNRLSFPPIHLQPYYRERFGYKPGDFPVSEEVFGRFIDIPGYPAMTPEQIDKVVNVICAAVESENRA